MAAPMAAQEAGETTPAALEARPPSKKIYEKGKPPLTPLLLLLLLSIGSPSIELCEKLAATLAAQKAGKTSPMTVAVGPAPVEVCRMILC
jgi:hypothetical protein